MMFLVLRPRDKELVQTIRGIYSVSSFSIIMLIVVLMAMAISTPSVIA